MPHPPSHLADASCPGAVDTVRRIRGGSLSVAQAVQDRLRRIAQHEPAIRAWAALDTSLALEQAVHADLRSHEARALMPLHGVAIGVKDLIDTRQWPTGCGSPIRAVHRPPRDAWIVRRLLDLGAVLMGKTVTTEFGYFQPGPTANPWNPAHTPGGSSSGSAAAVAAGMVPLALGTQTAGSLIRPASYCGVYALKASHGRYPLEGIQGLSHSLDTLGWLARDADDLELLRSALDDEPWTPLPDVRPRLLACRTHEWPLIGSDGAQAWTHGLQALADGGASLHEIDPPPDMAGLFEAQKIIMAWEAARTLADDVRQHRAQMSAPLVQLIVTGQQVAEADYRAAQALAADGRQRLAGLLGDADALLVPAAPGEAPPGLQATGDPAFSRVWNLLGNPCVNVPGLRGPNGLPIGLQLIGRPAGERDLLAVARHLGQLLSRAPAPPA